MKLPRLPAFLLRRGAPPDRLEDVLGDLEDGVRVALGAGPAHVLWAIFRRPLTQIAGGLLLGLLISAALSGTMDGAAFMGKPLLVLLGYAALVTSLCLLACVMPVRRALAIEPSQALAAEG